MKKKISIIGGGSSALFVASFLDSKKFDVTIYEKNKTLGRKFLVAGKGGFNLTHSENIADFIERYTPSKFLKKALVNFDNNHFRDWLKEIGIETYVGSSKRIYPEKGIKPIEVLNAIISTLEKKNVAIKYNHTWLGFNAKNELLFNENRIVSSDITIFALGGGSWKVTGSNGTWLNTFKNKGISTIPFQVSNCAFGIGWKPAFIKNFEGKPLKNIAITCNNKQQKGEAVITKFGLEGNAIYGLSPQIREQLKLHEKAQIYIDLKPAFSLDILTEKVEKSTFKNTTQILKKELKLSEVQIGLLKKYLTKEVFLNEDLLVKNIKRFPLEITETANLDEAISTVGGISLNAVDENFELRKLQNHFCIGEMLDWDAPTGGYLLQACASMGVFLAKNLNKKFTEF
ncbi:NAD(P)/FAD-dependent oxidoreductase [Polaribacter cellanae]|uniref:TIGR03862 family flavoprotein n=1 Tax=Polaribacter cellanae TaxID=2818493 RepID=A0A975CKL0_9FLAO|nr:TIGR03862 family flavoprotein [Polaribacter cellanae]QTE21398.1 TIGR03862 family flavoprotein [Polaribacter cellanae]